VVKPILPGLRNFRSRPIANICCDRTKVLSVLRDIHVGVETSAISGHCCGRVQSCWSDAKNEPHRAFGAEHLSQQRSSNCYQLGSGESVVSEVTIYHNTSRSVLGLIRTAGIEPTIIEYLKTPTRPADPALSHRAHGVSSSRVAPA
jgi:hypothetical protein